MKRRIQIPLYSTSALSFTNNNSKNNNDHSNSRVVEYPTHTSTRDFFRLLPVSSAHPLVAMQSSTVSHILNLVTNITTTATIKVSLVPSRESHVTSDTEKSLVPPGDVCRIHFFYKPLCKFILSSTSFTKR